eukprot:scaffold301_cov204-Alexandrium_tamarense.AAC.14
MSIFQDFGKGIFPKRSWIQVDKVQLCVQLEGPVTIIKPMRRQQLINKGVDTSKNRAIGGRSGLGFHIRPPTIGNKLQRIIPEH